MQFAGEMGSSSSSGEEDGDAEWKAAIDSVAGTAPSSTGGGSTHSNNIIIHQTRQDKEIKRYQTKAQELLDIILGKSIEIVNDPIDDTNSEMEDGGIRLFKDAPVGIVFDHSDQHEGPRRRPRILPGEELNEKSKKFKLKVESVTVDGMNIITAAQEASKKSLTKMEARDAARKAAIKREEERVAQLKKVRGERWLPSIAKCMPPKSRAK